MPKRYYYKREFLNSPGRNGGAYILAEVGNVQKANPNYIFCSADIEIADCTRRVVLTFDVDGKKEYFDNDLKKVDLLITTLQEFRVAMVEQRENTLVARKAAKKAAKKVKENEVQTSP